MQLLNNGKLIAAEFQEYNTWDNKPKLTKTNIFQSPEFIETKRQETILDYTTWTIGTFGTQIGFGRLGVDGENEIIEDYDPWGKLVPIWKGITLDDVNSNRGNSGWNTPYIYIDNTKMYRFSVWVNRYVYGTNGNFYLGTRSHNISQTLINLYRRVDGTETNNPYFWVSNFTNRKLPENRWVFVVGYVWPAGSGIGNNHELSGLYYTNGENLNMSGFVDWVWHEDTVMTRHRSYLYYCTDLTTDQRWCYPRIDLIDGNEPTLSELLSGFDSNLFDYTKNLTSNNNQFLSIRNDKVYVSKINEVGVT